MPANNTEIEKRLWNAADELRANSRLRAADYSRPVLGLIFLRYAGHRFDEAHEQILAERAAATHRLPPLADADYHARGVLYVPDEARFDHLLNLPEGESIGRAINDAMKAIEEHNPKLKDVLPKTFNRLGNDTLKTLLTRNIPPTIDPTKTPILTTSSQIGTSVAPSLNIVVRGAVRGKIVSTLKAK